MIRKISLVLALSALLPMAVELCHADDFSAYNEMYRNEQFEDAYKGYAAGLAKDRRNPGLWYNAGNALYRMNRIGDAVYAYTQAFMLSPRDSDVLFNLEYAMRQSGQALVPEGTPRSLYLLFYSLSRNELRTLIIVLFWLGMAAACAALLLNGKAKKYAMRTAICMLALLLPAAGWQLARNNSQFSASAAVVTNSGGIKLLSGPGESFRECAAAPEGRIVRILNSNDDRYYEIGLDAEGLSGWALKSGVKRI